MPALLTRISSRPNALTAVLHDVLAAFRGSHAVVVGYRLPTLALDFFDHRIGRRSGSAGAIAAPAQVIHHHLGAFTGQQQRLRPPQPTPGPRDNSDLALQSLAHIHTSSFMIMDQPPVSPIHGGLKRTQRDFVPLHAPFPVIPAKAGIQKGTAIRIQDCLRRPVSPHLGKKRKSEDTPDRCGTPLHRCSVLSQPPVSPILGD